MTGIIKKTHYFLSRHPFVAIFWTSLMLLVCLWPAKDIPDNPIPGFDKIVHVGLFAVWATLWTIRFPDKVRTIIGVGVLYGFLIEVFQYFLPLGRSFDLTDLLADSIGILLGLLFFRYVVQTYLQRLY